MYYIIIRSYNNVNTKSLEFPHTFYVFIIYPLPAPRPEGHFFPQQPETVF